MSLKVVALLKISHVDVPKELQSLIVLAVRSDIIADFKKLPLV